MMELQELTHTGPSLERIYPLPDDASESVRRHRARYEFAAQFVQPDAMALDCACGSGYGSEILARSAKGVIGVDKSPEALEWAKAHHDAATIRFMRRDIEEIAFQAGSFGAVVTLETLEHLPPEVCWPFLANAATWVQPGGVLVASSPMLRYRDGQPYVTSPWHVNEMPRPELLEMFADCLPGFVIHLYHQKQGAFAPLLDEDTGFCVAVARRKE
jgi:SAM-dependent methyltransferase